MPGGFSESDRAALLRAMEEKYDRWIAALRRSLPDEASRAQFDALSRAQQEGRVDKALDLLAAEDQQRITQTLRVAQLLDALRRGNPS